MFVQARDSVEGSGCRGDGCQIPPSVHDQPGQSETVMLVLPILWHVTVGRDPIRVLVFFFHFFIARLDSHLETITPVVSTPVWTLTVMRTSISSLTVSTVVHSALDLGYMLFIHFSVYVDALQLLEHSRGRW